ncbi:membrane protein insertion efficiency factor YidD [Rosettibacter firmus]|uniref:membrane protein insertion efficiency factor YidD n=1 Tax=Rosettibacter firmus TaxID=3111522 RepID=UPI00336BE808
MKYFLCVFLFTITLCKAQSDWIKWDKVVVSYKIHNESNSSQKNEKDALTFSKAIYNFFISDLDGDNCPFNPSCSEFFIEAVRKTDILQGTLIFVDRFTRELNLFKRINGYPKLMNGKLYDPVTNYF